MHNDNYVNNKFENIKQYLCKCKILIQPFNKKSTNVYYNDQKKININIIIDSRNPNEQKNWSFKAFWL